MVIRFRLWLTLVNNHDRKAVWAGIKRFLLNKTLFQQCPPARSDLSRAATETDQIKRRHHGASQKNSCGVNTQEEGGKRRKYWQTQNIWVRLKMSTWTDDKTELLTDATQAVFPWPKISRNYNCDFQALALNGVKRKRHFFQSNLNGWHFSRKGISVCLLSRIVKNIHSPLLFTHNPAFSLQVK